MIEWFIRLLERRSQDHEKRVQEALPHVLREATAIVQEASR